MPFQLNTANGGQTEGLAGVTKQMSGWVLKQKAWSWSGDDYKILDERGNVAFKVSGFSFDFRNTMLFKDAEGNNLALLAKKLLVFRATYKLYTFNPNYPGQPSTDKEKIEGIEMQLYRYSFIQQQLGTLLGTWRYKLYRTNEEKVEVWEARANFSLKFNLVIKRLDTMQVIAEVGQTSFFQFEQASK